MTPSSRPPSRPPLIILDILTSHFYSTQQNKSRDGLGFDLTLAQVVRKYANRREKLFTTFFLNNNNPAKFDQYTDSIKNTKLLCINSSLEMN